MKTRISILVATIGLGLTLSGTSNAASFAKIAGVDGSSKSNAGFNKKVDGFSVEQSVIEARSQKPKEIVVVGSKTPAIEGDSAVKKVGALKIAKRVTPTVARRDPKR